jgi:hypothetical protein
LEKHLLSAARQCTDRSIFASRKTELHHTASSVKHQQWCDENLIDFMPKTEWPPSSPDLNPLDFSIWDYMLAQLKNFKYQTLPDFKEVIIRIWAAIPDDFMCAVCNASEKRLRPMVINKK